MGACMSKNSYSQTKEEIKIHKEIERKIQAERKVYEKEKIDNNKLLLLGPAESGKSTLLRQLKFIYAKGLTSEERASYRSPILRNLIESMLSLLEAINRFNLKIEDEENQEYAKYIKDNAVVVLQNYEKEFKIPKEFADKIKKVWETENAIQLAYARRNEFNLIDSAKYYLDVVDRICVDDYVPTDQDILQVRIVTTEISETKVTINRVTYSVYDVGGQTGYRKRWIPYFDDSRAIIFMVAISSYDQMLVEDSTINRMDDALHLFDEICNNDIFKKTAIMLFLSKIDIFREKIKTSSISTYFPSFKGGSDYTAATTYFGRKFIKLNRDPDKQIYTHLTWATDTNQVKVVMAAVADIIRRFNLRTAGLM